MAVRQRLWLMVVGVVYLPPSLPPLTHILSLSAFSLPTSLSLSLLLSSPVAPHVTTHPNRPVAHQPTNHSINQPSYDLFERFAKGRSYGPSGELPDLPTCAQCSGVAPFAGKALPECN